MKLVEIRVHITQNMEVEAPLYGTVMESGCTLVKKCGTAPKQNLTASSFFEISTSNLKHNLFIFLALIFLQF